MATLTVQPFGRPGIVPTFEVAESGGDDFANNETEFLLIKNDDASVTNVTIAVTQVIDGGAVTAQPLSVTQVPANDTVLVGPFTISTYSVSVSISYSKVTSLGVALLTSA